MHKEAEADSIFQNIRKDYEMLAEKAKGHTSNQPIVFFGSYDAGNWYAPPSNSYAAQFIRDAGARYLFEGDTASSNIVIPAEEFMAKAPSIQFWGKLLASDHAVTSTDFTMNDERFMHAQAQQTGGLFYCNTKESDYHGDALIEPHKILSDLIGIFHGNQFTSESRFYFKKVEQDGQWKILFFCDKKHMAVNDSGHDCGPLGEYLSKDFLTKDWTQLGFQEFRI